MKKIRIGFTRTASPLGWLIRKVLNVPYNHVMMINEEGLVIEANAFGVVFGKKYSKRKNVIFLFYKEVDEIRYQEIWRYLLRQVGKSYQFFSLVTILFKMQVTDRGSNRFICSELAARACYKEMGYSSAEDALDKCTPKDVYEKVKSWNDGRTNTNII